MSGPEQVMAAYEQMRRDGLAQRLRERGLSTSEHLAKIAETNVLIDGLKLALNPSPLYLSQNTLKGGSGFRCGCCGQRVHRRRAKFIQKQKAIRCRAGNHACQSEQHNRCGGILVGHGADSPLKAFLTLFDIVQQRGQLVRGVIHKLLSRWWIKREKAESGAGDSPTPTSAEANQ